MKTHKSHPATIIFLQLLALLIAFAVDSMAKPRRPPSGGRVAVIVDERLSALRHTPALSGKLLQRVGRGRLIAILKQQRTHDGVVFSRVKVTSRTQGWMQREAFVSRAPGDDRILLRLIESSQDFDRLARARVFLDTFSKSPLRPAVLLILGDTAEQAADKLSRDAARRLPAEEMAGASAPEASFFLNFNGLDRFNRQGITFVFDSERKRFHYDGAAWRETVRRYPRSREAVEARKRLELPF